MFKLLTNGKSIRLDSVYLIPGAKIMINYGSSRHQAALEKLKWSFKESQNLGSKVNMILKLMYGKLLLWNNQMKEGMLKDKF